MCVHIILYCLSLFYILFSFILFNSLFSKEREEKRCEVRWGLKWGGSERRRGGNHDLSILYKFSIKQNGGNYKISY